MLISKHCSLVLVAFMVGIICTSILSGTYAGSQILSVRTANDIAAIQLASATGGNSSSQQNSSQQGFPGNNTSPIPYSGPIWNKITNACSGDQGGDADGDAICDNWENPSTPGNTATARYVKCPTSGGGTTFMDLLCNNNTVKYNLCINDGYASVWNTKPDGTPTSPTIICPKLGHKDVYLEIDSMTGREPNYDGIKDVIKAFGNSQVTNTATDDFGRSPGITLHVVKDESLTMVPAVIWAWQDTGGVDDGNYNNDFKSIKERHFGLKNNPLRMPDNPADETAPCPSNAPCSASTITGKKELLLKHFAYHYVTIVANWQGTPPTNCGPTGLAETLGNDFIVSLACAFQGGVGSKNDQAGTLMHELGHNLNLAHGGPLVNTPSFPTSQANINCKPNELSVMSWSRQIPAFVSASNWETYKFLDYSRGIVLTGAGTDPKEGTSSTPQLVESDGLKLPPGFSNNLAVYATPGLVPAARSALVSTAVNPIDWSGTPPPPPTPPNGIVFQDVNNFGLSPQCVTSIGASPDGQVLKSMDEWNSLKYYFLNDGDSQDGVPDGDQYDELTGEMVLNLTKLRDQFLGLLDPINSNGSSIFTRGEVIPVKLQVRDFDGNLMAKEDIAFSAERINGSLPSTKLLSSYGPSQFTYNNMTDTYLFDWPTTDLQEGLWGIHAVINITSTNNQSLLQGPPPIPSGMTGMLSIKP
jgi:hypothetical protein